MKNSWPQYTREEIIAVSNVLSSAKVNYLFGEMGKKFEREFAEFTGTKYSLALANGTLALDIALRAIQISKGDEVIVTPRSFIASVSCINLLGAKPVFVDIEKNSQNISPDQISQAITKKTKAIICVHLAGMPCEMAHIMNIAKKYNLFVIEDCAQAHGAKYKGKSVGSIGHIGAWSFCNDKIMTLGGEGGMITTNSKKLHLFAQTFNNHGKNFKKIQLSGLKKPFKFKYVHDSIGSNYRLTEMQSALGRIQLRKMKSWTKLRNRNASEIYKAIEDLPIVNIPLIPDYIEHAFYKCYILLNKDHIKTNWSRDKIIQAINDKGLPCFSGSCPEIYLEKTFKKNFNIPRLPIAKEVGEESLMFLVHPTITKKELLNYKKNIREVLKLASKNL